MQFIITYAFGTAFLGVVVRKH